MTSVGLRELKNRLGAYVDRVRKGERIAVTDRGKIVAELAPAGRVAGDREALAELARRGELVPGRKLGQRQRQQRYRACPRATKATSAARLLEAERDES